MVERRRRALIDLPGEAACFVSDRLAHGIIAGSSLKG
jgi:hypothetical protein